MLRSTITTETASITLGTILCGMEAGIIPDGIPDGIRVLSSVGIIGLDGRWVSIWVLEIHFGAGVMEEDFMIRFGVMIPGLTHTGQEVLGDGIDGTPGTIHFGDLRDFMG